MWRAILKSGLTWGAEEGSEVEGDSSSGEEDDTGTPSAPPANSSSGWVAKAYTD
jgi:hypothetical protein